MSYLSIFIIITKNAVVLHQLIKRTLMSEEKEQEANCQSVHCMAGMYTLVGA